METTTQPRITYERIGVLGTPEAVIRLLSVTALYLMNTVKTMPEAQPPALFDETTKPASAIAIESLGRAFRHFKTHPGPSAQQAPVSPADIPAPTVPWQMETSKGPVEVHQITDKAGPVRVDARVHEVTATPFIIAPAKPKN